jgi:hypothetical protein
MDVHSLKHGLTTDDLNCPPCQPLRPAALMHLVAASMPLTNYLCRPDLMLALRSTHMKTNTTHHTKCMLSMCQLANTTLEGPLLVCGIRHSKANTPWHPEDCQAQR